MPRHSSLLSLLVVLVGLTSCLDDDDSGTSPTPIIDPIVSPSLSLYVLCEGNMGGNDCTLDRLDLATWQYERDVYRSANPGEGLGLGDVGNDLQLNGRQLWVVVNNSNRVVVLDAYTCHLQGEVRLAGPRCVAFAGGRAYVTCYSNPSGTVGTNEGEDVRGTVVAIDTASLDVMGRCAVGCRPEGLAMADGRAYVANSLTDPRNFAYDNTVSVVDLATLTEERRVEVGVNPGRVVAHGGAVYVATRGNYADVGANLVRLDGGVVTGSVSAAAASLWSCSLGLLYVGTTYDAARQPLPCAGIVNDLDSRPLLPDKALAQSTLPYGVALDEAAGTLFVTDATDFVSSGRLRAYDSTSGELLHTFETGVGPAHIAFVAVH